MGWDVRARCAARWTIPQHMSEHGWKPDICRRHVYILLTSCLPVSHPIRASNHADSVIPVVTGSIKKASSRPVSSSSACVQDMCTRAGCIAQVREEDLTLLVVEAATFMEKERARASKRARRHRDPRTRSVSVHTHVLLNSVPLIPKLQYAYSIS